MFIIGILCGLATALGHSLAYLCTRWYTEGRGRTTAQLLVLGHFMMGLVAAAALSIIWPDGLELDARWLGWLPGTVGTFVIAQSLLIRSLKTLDASRVAPLLGLKIAMLAVIATFVVGPLSALQWAGVAIAVGAAWLLNGLGGRMPIKPTLMVVLACVFYAACDNFILQVIQGAEEASQASTFHAAVFAVCVIYGSCGLIAMALLPWLGSRDPKAWRDALPYTCVWLSAMVTLYTAFAIVGLVLGAILQSTRGIISIAIGSLLAHMGHEHLETKASRKVFYQRLAAAGLMTLAVALYVMG